MKVAMMVVFSILGVISVAFELTNEARALSGGVRESAGGDTDQIANSDFKFYKHVDGLRDADALFESTSLAMGSADILSEEPDAPPDAAPTPAGGHSPSPSPSGEAAAPAPCTATKSLEGGRVSDIKNFDWSAVECVEKSSQGNSGGVYFVQTAKALVVVKPAFGAGEAVSFALSKVAHPAYMVMTSNDPEYGAFAKTMKRWIPDNVWNVHFEEAEKWSSKRLTLPAVMEFVPSAAQGLESIADLHSPDSWCEMEVTGGCLCDDDYRRNTEDCQSCLDRQQGLRYEDSSPLPKEVLWSSLLEGSYPEDMCSLVALDAFMMEHDQLPDLRNGTYIWNGYNVMITDKGLILNIDSAYNHNRLPYKGELLPGNKLDDIEAFVRGHAGSSDFQASYQETRGKLLTTLLIPSFPMLNNFGAKGFEGKLRKCGLRQSNVWEHFRRPQPGLDGEALWGRCSKALLDELQRLSQFPVEKLSQALALYHDHCTASSPTAGSFLPNCVKRDEFAEHFTKRQQLLASILKGKDPTPTSAPMPAPAPAPAPAPSPGTFEKASVAVEMTIDGIGYGGLRSFLRAFEQAIREAILEDLNSHVSSAEEVQVDVSESTDSSVKIKATIPHSSLNRGAGQAEAAARILRRPFVLQGRVVAKLEMIEELKDVQHMKVTAVKVSLELEATAGAWKVKVLLALIVLGCLIAVGFSLYRRSAAPEGAAALKPAEQPGMLEMGHRASDAPALA